MRNSPCMYFVAHLAFLLFNDHVAMPCDVFPGAAVEDRGLTLRIRRRNSQFSCLSFCSFCVVSIQRYVLNWNISFKICRQQLNCQKFRSVSAFRSPVKWRVSRSLNSNLKSYFVCGIDTPWCCWRNICYWHRKRAVRHIQINVFFPFVSIFPKSFGGSVTTYHTALSRERMVTRMNRSVNAQRGAINWICQCAEEADVGDSHSKK